MQAEIRQLVASDLPLVATAHVCLPSLAFTARTSSHKLMLRVVPLPASVSPHGTQSMAPVPSTQLPPPPRLQ